MPCISAFSLISSPRFFLPPLNPISWSSFFSRNSSCLFPISSHALSPSLSADKSGSLENGPAGLSAKERRKLRSERREQLVASKPSWREEIDDKLLEEQDKKRKRGSGRKYEMDVNRLSAKGLQWWMVFAPRHGEAEAADNLVKVLSQSFPDKEFKVVVPTVPSKRRLKDGRYSDSKLILHPGCIFVHAVMDTQVYDVVRRVPGVLGFFGAKVGHLKEIVMPTPVPRSQMDGVFRKVQKEEEELKRLRFDLQAAKKAGLDSEQRFLPVAETPVIKIGCKVRVVSGSYANFEGHIIDLNYHEQKVTTVVMIFGQAKEVELSFDQMELLHVLGGAQ